jgi:perosamine synthetase
MNTAFNKTLPADIVKAIGSVVGVNKAALHEPFFNGNEWTYLKDCLDSSFVSSVGEFVNRFELELSRFTGAKHAVAVVNGTSALHIALKLAGVQEGDEVLTPALTFIATSNAITYCNATPHFVDSEENTLGVNATKLREYLISQTEQRSGQCINRSTQRVIRAIVPVHTFGHPVDLDGLLSISHDFNIKIVEDAAESLGSYYHGQHTGTFGLCGTLSFNGNKTITTGGGGAILTNNTELALHAKHITTTAKIRHKWNYCHDAIGYNYRLPNLNAALGCAQLEQLNKILDAKKILFLNYKSAFKKIKGVKLMSAPLECKSNFWLQTLLIDLNNVGHRDEILSATNKLDFMTRPAWSLINEMEPFREFPSMNLDIAKSLVLRLINIPSSPGLILAKS